MKHPNQHRDHSSGFFFPTGLMKPPPSSSGKPVRFDRKPVKTGQIQISNHSGQFNRFPPVNENFAMSYAHINVKDHTKATICNHAYKYNSNKPCSLSGGPHFFFGLTSNARKVY